MFEIGLERIACLGFERSVRVFDTISSSRILECAMLRVFEASRCIADCFACLIRLRYGSRVWVRPYQLSGDSRVRRVL